MDWFSFSIGFLAFPLLAAIGFGCYSLSTRLLTRQDDLLALALAQRSTTLSFSPRLIGEIREEGEREEHGAAAQAS